MDHHEYGVSNVLLANDFPLRAPSAPTLADSYERTTGSGPLALNHVTPTERPAQVLAATPDDVSYTVTYFAKLYDLVCYNYQTTYTDDY
jgi:hypothetical protein